MNTPVNAPWGMFCGPAASDGGGDIPDWLFYALCALPFVLIALDFLDR
ncbi:MAG: hypothetical protein IJI36_07775 [Kiritimatiellae bacterium]|nr:hypothetical protein [Kiritimatiellia bacterium]